MDRPWIIRPARLADVPVVADFNQRLAWETEERRLVPGVITAGVAALIADPAKGEYFVAEADGRVIGQCCVTYEWSDWRNGNQWWFQSVYVEQAWRARGVFRALFEHVEQAAVAAGAVGLRLYVEAGNHVAQSVYQRRGMSRTHYQIFERELAPGGAQLAGPVSPTPAHPPAMARPAPEPESADLAWMRQALRLARRAEGATSPNPLVGAVLVRDGRRLGAGWHRRAGQPHAEIEALNDARRRGESVEGATLYVTLEPCCTTGRTPPCTRAILAAGIARVVVAATDPNPRHAGRGFRLLRRAGVEVCTGVLADDATRLNEAFNHWIVHRTPFVTVKAAMTLDGKTATVGGESRWITGEPARAVGMRLRRRADAILVGVNTVLADDPALTRRGPGIVRGAGAGGGLKRVVLDSRARTPVASRLVAEDPGQLTTIVVTAAAPARRVAALRRRVRVWEAPADAAGRVDLGWLLRELGAEGVTGLLVEGGGEVSGSFLDQGLVGRVAFFYAPLVVGGAAAARGVSGTGVGGGSGVLALRDVEWRRVGQDLYYTARVEAAS